MCGLPATCYYHELRKKAHMRLLEDLVIRRSLSSLRACRCPLGRKAITAQSYWSMAWWKTGGDCDTDLAGQQGGSERSAILDYLGTDHATSFPCLMLPSLMSKECDSPTGSEQMS